MDSISDLFKRFESIKDGAELNCAVASEAGWTEIALEGKRTKRWRGVPPQFKGKTSEKAAIPNYSNDAYLLFSLWDPEEGWAIQFETKLPSPHWVASFPNILTGDGKIIIRHQRQGIALSRAYLLFRELQRQLPNYKMRTSGQHILRLGDAPLGEIISPSERIR